MATERKFEKDKVYLRGPNGKIYDYEPLVANIPGYTAVVPNPGKIAKAQQAEIEAQQKELEEQQAADAAAKKAAQAEAAKQLAKPETAKTEEDKK